MVIGGSRDLPNGLWLSKTGDHFNFDLGDGLDDEAIAFRLAANNDPAIRSLMPDRQLQVFTSVGEWVVSGEPLTPTNIQVQQQSRIGSPRRSSGAAARRRWRDAVRRAQRPRDPGVPVRRHRAGLPGGRSGAARPAPGPGPGRPGLRPGSAALPDRDGGRLARQHRDLSYRRHRRLEPAGDRRQLLVGRQRRRPDVRARRARQWRLHRAAGRPA